MSNIPDLPAGMGWPFADATTGEFQSRAVRSRLQHVVNLGELIGAAGDGTTDNTAIFQAAFDAVGSGEHVTFILPTGVWLVGTLRVKSHTRIQGVTSGTFGLTSFDGVRTSVLKLKAGTNAPILTDYGTGSSLSYGIDIRDIAFDGNKANQSSAAALIELLDAASGQDPLWRLERVAIRNSKGDGLKIGTFRRALRLLDSVVIDNDGNGVTVGATDCAIIDTIVARNTGDGISISAGLQKVIGCDIFGNRNGIAIGSNGFQTMIVAGGIDRNMRHGVTSAAPMTVIDGTSFTSNSQETNDTYSNIDFGFPAVTAQGSVVDNVTMRHDSSLTNKVKYGVQTNVMVALGKISYNLDSAPWVSGEVNSASLTAFMLRSRAIRDGADILLGTSSGSRLGTGSTQKLGFWGATPIARPTVTGSKGGNAALTDLLAKLAAAGLITDSTS